AAAGPAAAATVAAALTPHFSSSCLTNPAISSTERLLSCSTSLSVSAILFFPPVAAFESLRRIKTDSHRLGQFRFLFVVCRATAPVAAYLPGEARSLHKFTSLVRAP